MNHVDPTHKYNAVVTVEKELFRSCNKYDWSQYSYLRMVWVIFCELMELVVAVIKRDVHGKHGVYVEAGQISACCQKLMLEVSRRSPYEEVERATGEAGRVDSPMG